jgi:serine/threonine protein kinase/Tfp pilus assembly protein PilF
MSVHLGSQAASHDVLVGRVVDDFAAALDRGEHPQVEDFAGRYPEIGQILREVLTALEFVRAAGPSAERQDETPAEETPVSGTLGDFHILREVGRGGMGVVYEAEQISLGRRVALKVLPFAAALDARQLQRFKNEAQAAAGLHHTNIVPVYYVGSDRGVNYYAMQYIDGQTLAQMIAHLRRQVGDSPNEETASGPCPPATPPEATAPYAPLPRADRSLMPTPGRAGTFSTEYSARDPTFFRTVASLGIQAGQALEHAHQLGVIHRDIKPGNLLLETMPLPGDDSLGSTHLCLRLWVTDFGLAHCRSQAGPTMTGDLVGTLRYMSPEQALAKRVVIDHRTDIYSLGATLYELLTLHPVFGGSDREELLRQIAFEEPRPPRRLNKAVPAELETIVLKALEKNPADRYATAQELADDLERYLKDEPIRARRPGLPQRLRKWARRNRAAVWSAAASVVALLVMAVIALTLGLVAVQKEQDRTQGALDLEAKRRQQLRDVLDSTSSQVIDELLAGQKVLLPEHKKFLELALAMYEDFARDSSEDEKSRAGVARAYLRVGGIRHRLGQIVEAEAAYKRAQELFTNLLAESPGTADYRSYLARSHGNLAIMLNLAGRSQAAEQEFQTCLLLHQQLAADLPDRPEHRDRLAMTHNGLGALRQATGRFHDAEGEFQAALTLLTRLAADFPGEASYRLKVAGIHDNLGLLLHKSGRFHEAEREFGAALALQKQLVDDLPAVAGSRRDHLSQMHINLGRLLATTGRAQQAEKEYRIALTLCRQLAAEFPAVPDYRQGLARAHSHLAHVLRDGGQAPEAQVEFQAALALFKQLAADFPTMPAYLKEQAGSHSDLGGLLADTGHAQEAEEEYRKALALHKQISANFPAFAGYRDYEVRTHVNLGHLLNKTNRSKQAEEEYRVAVALAKQVGDQFPKAPEAQALLAHSHDSLASLLMNTRRHSEAEDEFGKALSICKQLASTFPTTPAYHSSLGAVLNNFAMLLLRKDGQLREARVLLEQAVEHQQKALQTNPRNPTYRQFLVNHFCNLAQTLLRLGEHAAGAQAAEDLARAFPDSVAHICGACVFLYDCRRLAAEDALLAEADRQATARDYARRARRFCRNTARRLAKDMAAQNQLAWCLAVYGGPSFLDGALAVKLAQLAVQADPGNGVFWNTLGAAHYRAGDWPAAVAALEKAMARRSGGNVCEWFFLAMAHWQLGHKRDAHSWYKRAQTQMAQHAVENSDLRHMQAEAAALVKPQEKTR